MHQETFKQLTEKHIEDFTLLVKKHKGNLDYEVENLYNAFARCVKRQSFRVRMKSGDVKES